MCNTFWDLGLLKIIVGTALGLLVFVVVFGPFITIKHKYK